MKSISNLLSVVMDGIRDSNMLYDYADQAEIEGHDQLREWFTKKAEDRTQRTVNEWADAKSVIRLNEMDD